MLHKLTVKNYQSLKDVTLVFGKFTVIVGPSSSVKSAVLRSLTALASNERGTESIRFGATSYSISAETDSAVVTLERGKTNQYKIFQDGKEELYTKLNGKVPEEVTKALNIAPLVDGKSVNYADQYAQPYLLKESAGEVARVLGELTGINKIFEAVKEANKRKTSFNSLHKTRVEDLSSVEKSLTAYAYLPEEISKLKDAESRLKAIQALEAEIAELSEIIMDLEQSAEDIAYHSALVAPPSLDKVRESYATLDEYSSLLRELIVAQNEMKLSAEQLTSLNVKLVDERQRLHEFLQDYGFCPMCEKEI